MASDDQPQLTAGDQLELELRGRLVAVENHLELIAAVTVTTCLLFLALLAAALYDRRQQ
jgi:hypothetical protein